MAKDLLLVDPDFDRDQLFKLQALLHDTAEVTVIPDFPSARTLLRTAPPDLLVANLRLDAYNGLHLVLLAHRHRTRCVVYAREHDVVLASQAQAMGAFYERLAHLPYALPAYVHAGLPFRDRRDLLVLDRRRLSRRGRRSTDVPPVYAARKQQSATVNDDPR